MHDREDAWREPQAQRWQRPDAHRWMRPDAYRWQKPEVLAPARIAPRERRSTASLDARELADILEVQARMRAEFARIKFELLRRRYLARKYNPNQPRVPAGNPDGGQWTAEGGAGAGVGADGGVSANVGITDRRVLSDARADSVRPGTQYAQEEPPPLRRVHPDTTYASDPGAKRSLEYWRQQPTDRIVESLKPGGKEALRAYPDGSLANGNTRIKVLQERGYDVNSLPREVRPRPSSGGSGPRGGGGGGGLPGGGGLRPWLRF